MQYLKQSTAATIMFGTFVDKADGVTLKTDATTITDIDHASTGIFLSKAGGTAAIRHADVTASVADAYGMMKVTLDATDTNTVGTLDVLFAKAATYLPVHKSFMVLPANVYDSLMGTDLLDVSVTQIGGVAQSLTDLKDFVDTGYDPSSHKVQGVVLTDTCTTNTDMRGTNSASLASVCTETRLAKLDAANLPTDIADIKTQVGVAGAGLTAVPWNAAWDAEVQSECTDALNAYDPPTKAELDTAQGAVTLANGAHGGAAATIQAAITGNITGNLSGSVGSVTGAVGSVTGAVGSVTGAVTITSNADITAILADTNELQTDWANGGRLDLILDAAGSAGDPWTTALPGAYGAGSAGKIVGDYVNSSIAAVKTVVDTIQADTDLLDDAVGGIADIHTDIGTIQTMLTDIHGTDLPAVKADTAAILTDTGTTLENHLTGIEGRLPAALTASGNIVADIKAVNNVTLAGAGTVLDPWRPA